MSIIEHFGVQSKGNAIVPKYEACTNEDTILLVTKNSDNSGDNISASHPSDTHTSENLQNNLTTGNLQESNLLPMTSGNLQESNPLSMTSGNLQESNLLPMTPGNLRESNLLPMTSRNLQESNPRPMTSACIQVPKKPLNRNDPLSYSSEFLVEKDLLSKTPQKPFNNDLCHEPQEQDPNILLKPPEEPLYNAVVPDPPEILIDSDLLPQPPERPLDSDLLPQPPERPLDSDVLPQPPEQLLDSDVLPQPPERPLDSDLLPQPPELPLDSDCCGTGCVPCVFDIHTQEMKIWEKECHRIRQRYKAGYSDVQEKSAEILKETEYRQFTLASITKDTKDTQLYRFHLPMDRSLGLKLGQHVILRGQVDGEVVTRQYTPVSDVGVTDYFELLIKLYEDGKMSQFIRTWSLGTKVDLRGPFGEFSYTPNKHDRLLMLAAGSGIAPMAQIIHSILNNENDDTRIQLLYACRCYGEILLKSWLEEWSQFWNFSVLYVLSQEPEGGTNRYRYGDRLHTGHLDKDLLSNELQAPVVSSTRVLISGTKSFDNDMIKYCKILGIQDCDIHKF